MPDTENLRRRANLLLVLAQKARDDGHIKLAEDITDRATQLFDEAIILERGKIQLAGASMADRPGHGNQPLAQRAAPRANGRSDMRRPAAQRSTPDGEFPP
jgi:hypothetical protein